MATSFCPNCGDEFIASVTECPDCEVALVDEPPERPTGVRASGEDGIEPPTGQVEYELHEWAVESRVMLQSLLNAVDIPHVWEGTDLLVPAVVENRVDAMIAQVESTQESALDPDAPKIAYDLGDWDDETQAGFLTRLEVEGVPYEIDVDGALVVLEDDEARVDALIDELELADSDGSNDPSIDEDEGDAAEVDEDASGDDGEPVDDDGDDDELDDDDDDLDDDDRPELDAQGVMSDLFVAADRLKRKATDHEGVLTLVERARDVRRMRVPYGFSRDTWQQIVDATIELNDRLEGDDEEIEEQAVALRDLLRPYV